MELDKLRELIEIFQSSELSEIEVEEEGRRVRLSKAAPVALPVVAQAPAAIAPVNPLAANPPHPIAGPQSQPAPAEPVLEEGVQTIDSPMVGVFYASPSPGDPPYVKPGDTVEENQTVCIVEAMKLMNEVSAKFRCEIVHVLVENGEPVEYNQPLFAVKLLEG
ncbi:MAG: acetyl-CoA carboxylase biotin carboxyl carrier protein subunit [Candidatus Hydrogenedentota bacterium]